ncbi:MAG: hypothetical protein PSN34_03595 [Urechidicola sp.]|nr:hypothetical protein [Urechidicola sp.]
MEEYVEKTGVEKIKKKIIVDAFSKPATQKLFKDGHGKTPYLSSTDQLPDTIALITFHINDLKGIAEGWDYGGGILSDSNGNSIANLIHNQTLKSLKDAFKKRGTILLIPQEYLDTEEKANYYFETFEPEVSKAGKFLNNIEDNRTDKSVCANTYRYLDLGAAFDYKRSQSLGSELANNLNVEAVLSIAIDLYYSAKGVFISNVKMTIHGPNPNPKLDKKYYGQKTGTGYYIGQLYIGGTLGFKKPIKVIDLKQKKDFYKNFEGLEVIFTSFIEKFYDEMNAAINKVNK